MTKFGIDWGSPDTWRGLVRILQAVLMAAGIRYEFTEEHIVVIVAVGQAINGIIGLFFQYRTPKPKVAPPPSSQF